MNADRTRNPRGNTPGTKYFLLLFFANGREPAEGILTLLKTKDNPPRRLRSVIYVVDTIYMRLSGLPKEKQIAL